MVVLMIGVLSAMVLPKYTRVVDSFRVLEAEQLMRAVRGEQETRCTLGRKYTIFASKLGVLSQNRASGDTYTTSHFTYTLTNSGIRALSAKGYTLDMPSYLDGRICCDACAAFTKNYLTCTELEKLSDFQKVENGDACQAS